MAIYSVGAELIFDGTQGNWADWTSADEIKLMLVNNHTQSQLHNHRDDVSGDEISCTGYSAGGVSLTGATISTITSPSDAVMFDASDLTFSPLGNGSNATFDACIIYKEQGADSSDTLIGYFPLTETTTNGGDVTIQWPSTGLFYLDCTP